MKDEERVRKMGGGERERKGGRRGGGGAESTLNERERAWENGGAVDMGAWRVCASMLGPVRWVSASTWKRARHERERASYGIQWRMGRRWGYWLSP